MLPQLPYTKRFAQYEIEPSDGVVNPNDTMKVKVTLVGKFSLVS
jgi:hypothetical protein